jgi:hypothetical protein
MYLFDSVAMLASPDGSYDKGRFKSYTLEFSALLGGITISLLASVFGAIHCISWASTFPSPALRIIWRTCSMYITFYPLSLAAVPALVLDYITVPDVFRAMIEALFPVVLYTLSPLYIVARIILLVVAFWSLSTMPATGHQSIAWADYIPHL